MNKSLKDGVISHIRYLESLDEAKKKAKKELSELLNSCKDEIDYAFLDWYYWETDNSTEILTEILQIGKHQLLKQIITPKNFNYECPQCRSLQTLECKSRQDIKTIQSNLRGKQKHNYICEKCIDENKEKKLRKLEKQRSDKSKKLSEMPYSDFLRSTYWKKFSQERRRNANFKCVQCGRSDLSLQAHHLTYERRGHELPSDVIVLCEACHLEKHGKPIPKYMLMKQDIVSLRDKVMKAIGK